MIKGKKYYYHYTSVMSIIGDGSKLTLGFELCRPREQQIRDEGESALFYVDIVFLSTGTLLCSGEKSNI